MKPTLLLQPIHNSSAGILQSFVESKPLTSDQLNFLFLHQSQLSDAKLDPAIRYYLQKAYDKQSKFRETFLLKDEILNFEAIQALKKRLLEALKTQKDHLVVPMSLQQLNKFRKLNENTIHYYHSNILIAAHFFYPRGVPPVIYFSWGKYFGVIKYVISAYLSKIETSVLVYFENMENRNLNQCINDYSQQLKDNIELQKEMMYQHVKTNHQELDKTPEHVLSNSFLLHRV